jgi:opacity protein-like surface antigen
MKRFATSVLAVVIGMTAISAAHAQADIAFKGAGGKLSFVFPDAEGIDNALGAGVIADLGTIIPELGLQATLDFWSKSEDAGLAEYTVRDIVIGARTTYTFPLENNDIRPFVAGGLAIHFVKSEYDGPEIDAGPLGTYSNDYDDSDTKIGLDLGGGSNFAVSENVDILGEAMFRIVNDVTQFVISGGVIYWFGG